jgi:hypothetical protein
MPGSNTLLMGPAGTGKTHSLGTLVDAGLEVFYLDLENGLESFKGYWTDRNLPIPEGVHWHRLAAPSRSTSDLADMVQKINKLSFQALTSLSDPNRQKYDRMYKLLCLLNNFEDQRTGKSFGDVAEWSPQRVLAIDGLTGISAAAMSNVIGNRPTAAMSDWGVAQAQVRSLLELLCNDYQCHVVLIAHVEREMDEVLGGVKLMPSTLGKKLPPIICPLFSDVILTVREADKWFWDNAASNADVKLRNMPGISSKHPPTFGPLIERWRKREEAA